MPVDAADNKVADLRGGCRAVRRLWQLSRLEAIVLGLAKRSTFQASLAESQCNDG
jgi:hypothetical protein